MAGGENYEGFISKDEMLIIVERTIGTDNFSLNKFTIKPASEHPMGFLGTHAKIQATVTVNNENKELYYFIKKIPSAVPQHLDYALKTRAFYKEIELYKTLFIDLKEAQSLEKLTKWAPEYYYSRGEEIFVTEDLSSQGYYMLPERSLMDEEHIKASLKAMAAMHAASFVFEDKFNRRLIGTRSPNFLKPDKEKVTLGEIYSHLTFETEASDQEGHPGNTYYEAGIRSQLNIVNALPGFSQSEKEMIKVKLPDILRKMLKMVKVSDRYKNVFIHGDLWANNLLFRRENNGEVKALLIDFQLARYAPPAHDLVLFLHLVQTRDFRTEYETNLVNYYYERFSEELRNNGLSPEEILPKDIFLASYDDYYDLGLLSSVLYFQLILTPSAVTSKFLSSPELYMKNMFVNRSEMITEGFEKDEIFRTRMSEVMYDLIRRHIMC